jgi:hypothetical protein
MAWTANDSGFDYRQGQDISLFSVESRLDLGPTQPPMQWIPGAVSLGVTRKGREADRSPLMPGLRIAKL